jgi:hypothetical protein
LYGRTGHNLKEKEATMKYYNKLLCIFAVGMLVIVFATMIEAQGIRRIDVFTGRPLSDAIKILEGELDRVITYEDPIWENPIILDEIFKGGPVVLKSRRLTFQYTLGPPKATIEEILNQYHKQTNLARFELVVGPGEIYNVIPVKYLGKTGNLREIRSILDADTSHLTVLREVRNQADFAPLFQC